MSLKDTIQAMNNRYPAVLSQQGAPRGLLRQKCRPAAAGLGQHRRYVLAPAVRRAWIVSMLSAPQSASHHLVQSLIQ
jgi:hypothetical protein